MYCCSWIKKEKRKRESSFFQVFYIFIFLFIMENWIMILLIFCVFAVPALMFYEV